MSGELDCDHSSVPIEIASALHNKLWSIYKKYTENRDIIVLAGPYEYGENGHKGARTYIDLSKEERYTALAKLLYDLSKVPETVRNELRKTLREVPDNSVTWRLRYLTKATEAPH